MRLLAEERQTGTLMLLNTAPVREREIVLGKFLSAFGVLALLTLLTVVHAAADLRERQGQRRAHRWSATSGCSCSAPPSIAIGLFASALARSQVVAVIVGAASWCALIMLWVVARSGRPAAQQVLRRLALHHDNFRPFMHGILSSRASSTTWSSRYFFLLAPTKVLEARRWR